jgi:hypothetical protein
MPCRSCSPASSGGAGRRREPSLSGVLGGRQSGPAQAEAHLISLPLVLGRGLRLGIWRLPSELVVVAGLVGIASIWTPATLIRGGGPCSKLVSLCRSAVVAGPGLGRAGCLSSSCWPAMAVRSKRGEATFLAVFMSPEVSPRWCSPLWRSRTVLEGCLGWSWTSPSWSGALLISALWPPPLSAGPTSLLVWYSAELVNGVVSAPSVALGCSSSSWPASVARERMKTA